jgi:hypothetical protein
LQRWWCYTLTSPSQQDIPGDRLPHCRHLRSTTCVTIRVQHKQPSQASYKCPASACPILTMSGVVWIKLMFLIRLPRNHTYTLLKHLMPLSLSVCTSPDVQAHASSAFGLDPRVHAEHSVRQDRRPGLYCRHSTTYMGMAHL